MLTFQAEIDAFKQALPALLAEHREGEFAILKDCLVQQVCPTYERALGWGYEHYGLEGQFFVKQVCETPQVTHYTRVR